MKGIICVLVLVLLFLGFVSETFTQTFETIEIGKGAGSPKWSLDGTKLAFMSEGWLCVADADGKGQTRKVVEISTKFFEWISDSEFVVFEKEYPKGDNRVAKPVLRISKIDIGGLITIVDQDTTFSKTTTPKITRPIILPDGTVGFYRCKGGYQNWECDEFRIIKQGKLKPDAALKQMIATTEGYPAWGEINLESVDHTTKKRITPGKQYLFPELSPDSSKIIASYGPAEFVLDLNGNVTLDLGKELPEAKPGYTIGVLHAKWSPDSKKIVYEVTTEDGHNVYNVDIYVINTDGTGRTRLTNTPDEIESNPSWSPDGTKIAYIRSGKVLVIKLK
ncbi:MAG TPA: hypothetical protein VMT04_06625 [Terriglobales bacterium]|nr:hypothetical protein [Terriglobales bacterium]